LKLLGFGRSGNYLSLKQMNKTAYISPTFATLEVSAMHTGLSPTASIVLDLGIPKFTTFSIKFPIPEETQAFQQVASEALGVMLDEMTAFMISVGYKKEVIAKIYALTLACYKDLVANDHPENREKDPSIGSVRGEFQIPADFINETQRYVVTAGKKVDRSPRQRRVEIVPKRPVNPSKNDVLKAIRRYRFQSIKSQPFPLYLVVYDNMGQPKGTLTLGPGFHNELLKMQYKKKGDDPNQAYKDAVRAGGGVWKGIGDNGVGGFIVYFDNAATKSTLVLDTTEVTPEAVAAKIKWNQDATDERRKKMGRFLRVDEMRAWGTGKQDEYYAQHPELGSPGEKPNLVVTEPGSEPMPLAKAVRADYYDEQGFWAGDGGGASGILPVCTTTGRICFAWRSPEVQQGSCWGTIGGAIQENMQPGESAQKELREETGYSGSMTLHPAFVFQSGTFRYFNFIGETAQEFDFHPQSDAVWETEGLEWFTLPQVREYMTKSPHEFHSGVIALFKNSGKLIEQICAKAAPKKGKGDGKPSKVRESGTGKAPGAGGTA
jgi:8-oxo-dGTP pyrophosphatase MutT (NUDIX family)